jgi:hypothetical protein
MSPASTAQLYVVTETWTTWRQIETRDLLTDGQQKNQPIQSLDYQTEELYPNWWL